MAAVAFQFAVGQTGQHQRQMSPGAVARHSDLGGVDAVVVGIGTQPAQRGLDVVDLRRPHGFARQPVLRGHAHEAVACEQDAVAAQLAAIALQPAATVHEQDGRSVAARFRRQEDIAMQVATPSGAEDDVLLDAGRALPDE